MMVICYEKSKLAEIEYNVQSLKRAGPTLSGFYKHMDNQYYT